MKLDPLQAQLNARTMSERGGGMIGAPEVHQLGQNLIRLIGAKRVLDIGMCVMEISTTELPMFRCQI